MANFATDPLRFIALEMVLKDGGPNHLAMTCVPLGRRVLRAEPLARSCVALFKVVDGAGVPLILIVAPVLKLVPVTLRRTGFFMAMREAIVGGGTTTEIPTEADAVALVESVTVTLAVYEPRLL
jgi:hypothetical protein